MNTSICKFTVFGWDLNFEHIFLSICALFAKWFRGAEIYCKDKNTFLFQEEHSKHGFYSWKIIFRRWQIWVDPCTINSPAEWDLQIPTSALMGCFFGDSPLCCHLWPQALGEDKSLSLKDILENGKINKYPQNTGTGICVHGRGRFKSGWSFVSADRSAVQFVQKGLWVHGFLIVVLCQLICSIQFLVTGIG